jgi:hypothetical protein
LKYNKIPKKGKTANKEAEIFPMKSIFFSLCEYNQMIKIYTEKNKAARQETIKPNKAEKKFKVK